MSDVESAKRRVLKAVDQHRDEAISFLRELVRVPSVFGNEGAAQKVVERKLRDMNLSVSLFEPNIDEIKNHPEYTPIEASEMKGYGGRPNVVGRLEGSGGGRSIILTGHIDHIPVGPVEEWKHDPFGGEIEVGKMYGRGVADDKGGIATNIIALDSILKSDIKLEGDLTVISPIEEEEGGSGGNLACVIRGHRADGAIYSHPLDRGLKEVFLACAGLLCFKIRVVGKMVHGHRAHIGVNAIEKATKIIQALRDLDDYRARTVRFDLFDKFIGRSTNLHVGVIRGGSSPHVVPYECEMQGRVSFTPNERMTDIKKQIEDHIRKASQDDAWLSDHPPTVDWIGFTANPAMTDPSQPIAQIAKESIRTVTGHEPTFVGVPDGSDMRHFILYGKTPTVMIGPRGGGIHATDEWLDIDEYITAVKALSVLILNWCGVAM